MTQELTAPSEAEVRRIVAAFQTDEAALRAAVETVLVGQEASLRQLVTVLLAGGHALVEGVPGTGKTLLVRSIAQATGLASARVQFTPDLLPADILGCDVLITDETHGRERIEFRAGPVFTQFLLADEINRGTPRTQSALLEAMQERAVTIGVARHVLDPLFTTFATRNPLEMEGTYPLPEAQLDRFLLLVELAPADVAEMLAIVERTTTSVTPEVPQVLTPARLLAMRAEVRQVLAAPTLVRHAARLVRATQPQAPEAPALVRECVRHGAGVRALQALVLCAKVEALRDGRWHIARADLESALLATLRHRVAISLEGEARGLTTEALLDEVRRAVAREVQ